MKKIAVVLSGCGHLDGAEIRESVFTLLALDQNAAQTYIFAPTFKAHHQVNHLSGQEQADGQTIIEEAARIARGNIKPIEELSAKDFDGVIFPGGFGVAKNLCTFAFEGKKASVKPEVKRIINEFHQAKKPIGAICIAPALVALALRETDITITLGQDNDSAKEMQTYGTQVEKKTAQEVCIDNKNKIVSTPAYMIDDVKLSHAFEGINKLVQSVLELA